MIPSVEENLDPSAAANPRKRRGKAIEWKYVRKYSTITEAKENFTRGNLIDREQFLGRKYNGKTSAIYINCQKVVCGCMKKWRLVSCQSDTNVILEETCEEHSNHDLFVRSGGHGLTEQQIQLTQKALSLNHRMKPLQIVNFFRDFAASEILAGNMTAYLYPPYFRLFIDLCIYLYISFSFCLRTFWIFTYLLRLKFFLRINAFFSIEPAHVMIPAPDIVRLSSYLSYQRRKLSGTIISTSKNKIAILKHNDLTQSIQNEENDFCSSEVPISEQSTKKKKTDLSDDKIVENTGCDETSLAIGSHSIEAAVELF